MEKIYVNTYYGVGGKTLQELGKNLCKRLDATSSKIELWVLLNKVATITKLLLQVNGEQFALILHTQLCVKKFEKTLQKLLTKYQIYDIMYM